VLAALLMTIVGCSTLEERQERQRVTHQLVEQAISQRRMTIEVDHMQTQRYGNHRVTSDFCLKLRGDTLESYLPFFGQAYSLPYGSPSQGLNFTSPIYRFQQGTTRDGAVSMAMEVRSREDSFYYQLDIYPNGKAYIFVRPQERDVMHFSGELVAE
jgi:hypothetical protein